MLYKVNLEELDYIPIQGEGIPKQVQFERTMVTPRRSATNDSPMVEEESDEEEVPTQDPLQQSKLIAVRRQRREIKKPTRFTDMVAYALPVCDDSIPSTYPDAIRSTESGNWASAMEEETQSLKKNKTWKLTQLPERRKAIGCKLSEEDIRYKARLVAKGYAQKEVFSPVVKHSSIRILLALVA